jgi:putative phage-type endonuclease
MARKLVNTKEISHDEWLILRKKSIGGSDAGTVMGMNQYVSAITLYADKMGLSKAKETNEAMRLGNDLEEYVAQRFCEQTGKKVRRDNFMWMHDEYDFITANVDREVIGENAGLECKTMSSFANYDLEGGEVPAHYFCQCQHYMMVKGYDKMYLAILVFQKGVYILEIERDNDFIAEMLQAEVTFWTENIEKKQMPAPDGSEDSIETVKTLFPENLRDEIQLYKGDEKIKKYRELGDLIKNLEAQQDALKAELCYELGDAAVGVGESFACSWKTQQRTSVDTKRLKAEYPDVYEKVINVSKSRVFRTKELKKKEN